MTTKEKLNLIRPSLDFNSLAPDDFVFRTRAVIAGTTDNPNLKGSPVDPAKLQAALDEYLAKGTEALDSKKAKAEQEKLKMAIIRMLRQIAHWVEAASNGDMAIFLSSGLVLTFYESDSGTATGSADCSACGSREHWATAGDR